MKSSSRVPPKSGLGPCSRRKQDDQACGKQNPCARFRGRRGAHPIVQGYQRKTAIRKRFGVVESRIQSLDNKRRGCEVCSAKELDQVKRISGRGRKAVDEVKGDCPLEQPKTRNIQLTEEIRRQASDIEGQQPTRC